MYDKSGRFASSVFASALNSSSSILTVCFPDDLIVARSFDKVSPRFTDSNVFSSSFVTVFARSNNSGSNLSCSENNWSFYLIGW